MSDKFQFKWNNFQSTVSQSFGALRREGDLFDVTLVSEDEVQLSAHKVVLSASSSFFKSILRKNPHNHPLIYLSGVTSWSLLHVVDYIYQGQVQLREDQVETFLAVSNKLRIEGIVHDTSQKKTAGTSLPSTRTGPDPRPVTQSGIADIIKRAEDKKSRNNKHEALKAETVELEEDVRQNHPLAIIPDFSSHKLKAQQDKFFITDVLEADRKIQEVMTKDESGIFRCGVCDYRSSYKQSCMGHIENRHIEGLQFSCDFCEKTFKNRNLVNNHKSKYHSSRKSVTL